MFQKENLKSIISTSWAVSWPMMFIMFFIFLIGFCDVYIAGKFGKEVQAAYGLSNQFYFVLSIIVFALTVGAVSVVSRLFTSGNKQEFNIAVDSALVSSGIAGLCLSFLGAVFCGPIINNLNVPDILKNYAIVLARVYSIGLVFNYLLINSNGVLRACGLIKKSLWTMAVVCVLNIFLNFVLAFKTPLGFRGIAFATLISMFAGSVMNLFFVRRLLNGSFRFSYAAVKKILNVGWPSGLHQVFWQLGAMALFLILSALPEHNIEVMAAFTNGLKIESAIFLPALAFSLANAVVVGNLLGKKENDDAFASGIITAFMGVIIVLLLSMIVLFNARYIASFLSGNDIVIRESIRYIVIMLIAEPFMAWGVILAGGLNGAGDTRGVMLVTALSIWLVRIPLCYLLGVRCGLGAVSVWWAMNISIFVQSLFISRRYFAKKWITLAQVFIKS